MTHRLLIHPRQREDQESWGNVINNVSSIVQHEGEAQGDVDRGHRTKVLVYRPKYSSEDSTQKSDRLTNLI